MSRVRHGEEEGGQRWLSKSKCPVIYEMPQISSTPYWPSQVRSEIWKAGVLVETESERDKKWEQGTLVVENWEINKTKVSNPGRFWNEAGKRG